MRVKALKSIVSLGPVLLVILNIVLTALQTGQPLAVSDWMALVAAAITPLLVYIAPNLPPEVFKNLEPLLALLRSLPAAKPGVTPEVRKPIDPA